MTIKANRLSIGRLHVGQIRAFQALRGHRFKVLRCGRRFGKTDFARNWISDGLAKGHECAWFTPQHNTWSEVYSAFTETFRPLIEQKSRSPGVIRLKTGARLDFWALGNGIAGRGRRYHRVVIDEAAFGKDGDEHTDGSMTSAWLKAIKPTLYDFGGEALICSSPLGQNPANFFYRICTDPSFGFKEYHATVMDNPLLPMRQPSEAEAAWAERRERYIAALKAENLPLVYEQEYLARFVDWSGFAFFRREHLLEQGQGVPYPAACDSVFAVIDTASKTGLEHDGTAVCFFAYTHGARQPLVILDWDIVQIEGALLEHWLPGVLIRLDELARECRAACKLGAWIEDKNSGTVLLQQAQRRGLFVSAIESKLTSAGKLERAISVSGYVFRGRVKYSAHAFRKLTTYKQREANHLLEQVEQFRVADSGRAKEDDLLDTFCYGVAIALGNKDGY
jgi:hypothetical protein